MDFSGEETFPPHASTYQSLLYNTSHTFEAIPMTFSDTSASNDDHENDRTKPRTFLDTWSSQAQRRETLGAHKSLHHSLNKAQVLEQCLKKSSLQDQYWACAIPDYPPPCPNRASPHWDPNKEYQDMLDYTYPLNPKYFNYKDREESDTDPFFLDSGIGLDSYNISCDSKLHLHNMTCPEETEQKKIRYPRINHLSSPYAFSTPLPKTSAYRRLHNTSESSNETYFEDLSPYASKVDFSKCRSHTLGISSKEQSHKSGQFIPSTKILPLNNYVDSDEEYLSLPSSLKEIENLATHLKDLSLCVGKNVCTTFEQDTDGIPHWFSCQHPQIQETANTKKSTVFEPQMNAMNQKKFSSLRDMLDGGAVASQSLKPPGSSPVQGNISLVQSIQKFCHHLDALIQWLYSIAEITDKWVNPKSDVGSIQLSLSIYLKFKKDIVEHQTLADTVMKHGELLLKNMSVNSSALKDTLTLISKQSGELERQAERLYSSVLDAMDTITDDSLERTSNLKQCVSLEMESS
ncbi:centrosomal protein of 68 kDa [Rhinophrynus dorsalis]